MDKILKNTLKAGDMLQNGKYLIIKALGQGNFGITYQCSQTFLNKKVIVKEYFLYDYCERFADKSVSYNNITLSVYEGLRIKYLEEAKILAKCVANENIINTLDTFDENNTSYFVTDHLSGAELRKYVLEKNTSKLSETDAVKLIGQIAKGVNFLHLHNIFHFNLNPEKVFITKKGYAVIVDFGISRKDIPSEISGYDLSLTNTSYSSLEILKANENTGAFSDIYSLGAVLYFMLTGQDPPSSKELLKGTLIEPQKINPLISDDTNRIIKKAMETDPNARYQRVESFINSLPDIAEKPVKKSLSKILLWVALGIISAGLLGYLYTNLFFDGRKDIPPNDSNSFNNSVKLSELSLKNKRTRGMGIVLENPSTHDSICVGTYYALIIGVEQYKGTGFSVLYQPVNDAHAFHSELINDYMIDENNIIQLDNPTKAEIYEKLEYYRTQLKEIDNLLIFYAGHGYYDTISHMGYVIPKDGIRNNIANWISFKNLKDEFFSVFKAKHILFVADACQAGSVFRGGDELPVTISDITTLNQLKLKSRYAFTSVDLGYANDNSDFIKQIIRSLKSNKNNVILAQDLFIDVRNGLKDSKSNDDPVRFGELDKCGSEGGDFLFIRRQDSTAKPN